MSENDLTSLVDRKNSENTKKGTKVALNVFRVYFKERKVDEESLGHRREGQVGKVICTEEILC